MGAVPMPNEEEKKHCSRAATPVALSALVTIVVALISLAGLVYKTHSQSADTQQKIIDRLDDHDLKLKSIAGDHDAIVQMSTDIKWITRDMGRSAPVKAVTTRPSNWHE